MQSVTNTGFTINAKTKIMKIRPILFFPYLRIFSYIPKGLSSKKGG